MNRMRSGFSEASFEALFEIAAVFGAGHHRSDVQRQDAFLGKDGRDGTGSNALRDAFHNGRFPNARFADEHGVVLLSPAQDLDDTGNLCVPAHYGIQFPFAGSLGEVVGEFFDIQLLVLLFRRLFRTLGGLFGGLVFRSCPGAEQPLVFHVCQEPPVIYAMGAEKHLPITLRRAAQGQ